MAVSLLSGDYMFVLSVFFVEKLCYIWLCFSFIAILYKHMLPGSSYVAFSSFKMAAESGPL